MAKWVSAKKKDAMSHHRNQDPTSTVTKGPGPKLLEFCATEIRNCEPIESASCIEGE